MTATLTKRATHLLRRLHAKGDTGLVLRATYLPLNQLQALEYVMPDGATANGIRWVLTPRGIARAWAEVRPS